MFVHEGKPLGKTSKDVAGASFLMIRGEKGFANRTEAVWKKRRKDL